MRIARWVTLCMLFGLVLACNGDDKRKAANADTGTPLGQGVVEKVEGRVEDAKDLPEGK